MDDRTQAALRAWREEPGDRDAFDHWWASYTRSEGLSDFEARIRVSGLWEPADQPHEWIHARSGTRFLEIPAGTAPFHIGSETVELNNPYPFLMAAGPVLDTEAAKLLCSDTPTRGVPRTVTWPEAAGYCEQARLRLPTAAMCFYAQTARGREAPPAKWPSGTHLLQDYYEGLENDLGMFSPELFQNIYAACRDSGYSSPLWTQGSPADLVFEQFLMDFDAGECAVALGRVSRYGLNVLVAETLDRNGKKVVIEADPLALAPGEQARGGDAPAASAVGSLGDTAGTEQSSTSLEAERGSLAEILSTDEDSFHLSGAEIELPVTYEHTLEDWAEVMAGVEAGTLHPGLGWVRASLLRSKNEVAIAPVMGRSSRNLLPVWR